MKCRVEIKNLFNFHDLIFENDPDNLDNFLIKFHFKVLSVETGEECMQTIIGSIHKSIADNSALLAEKIKLLMLKGFEHEIDECLFINGERINDPHFCKNCKEKFAITCNNCFKL